MKVLIIGGGPSGLVIAKKLKDIGDDVTLIDSSLELGGCHKTMATEEGYFAEHSPRVYSETYINTFDFIKACTGKNYTEYFTEYKTSGMIKYNKVLPFTLQYILFILGITKHQKDTSMAEFIKGYSVDDKEYFNKLCTTIDGVDTSNFTLYKFMTLIDNFTLGKLYHLNNPSKYLFKDIKVKLLDAGIMIIKDSILSFDSGGSMLSESGMVYNTLNYDKVIFSIPPQALAKIKGSISIFPDIETFDINTRYDTSYPFTVVFKTKGITAIKNGLGVGEWNIICDNITNYFKDPEFNGDITFISCLVTKLDTRSSVTGKTFNDSTKDEIKDEIVRQLRQSLDVNVPLVYIGSVSKNTEHGVNLNRKWASFPSQSPVNKKFYTVGIHNGNSKLHVSTMENAVQNALFFCKKKIRHHIKESLSLLIIVAVCMFVLSSVLVITWKKQR